jgi:hypothetical protein
MRTIHYLLLSILSIAPSTFTMEKAKKSFWATWEASAPKAETAETRQKLRDELAAERAYSAAVVKQYRDLIDENYQHTCALRLLQEATQKWIALKESDETAQLIAEASATNLSENQRSFFILELTKKQCEVTIRVLEAKKTILELDATIAHWRRLPTSITSTAQPITPANSSTEPKKDGAEEKESKISALKKIRTSMEAQLDKQDTQGTKNFVAGTLKIIIRNGEEEIAAIAKTRDRLQAQQ